MELLTVLSEQFNRHVILCSVMTCRDIFNYSLRSYKTLLAVLL